MSAMLIWIPLPQSFYAQELAVRGFDAKRLGILIPDELLQACLSGRMCYRTTSDTSLLVVFGDVWPSNDLITSHGSSGLPTCNSNLPTTDASKLPLRTPGSEMNRVTKTGSFSQLGNVPVRSPETFKRHIFHGKQQLHGNNWKYIWHAMEIP